MADPLKILPNPVQTKQAIVFLRSREKAQEGFPPVPSDRFPRTQAAHEKPGQVPKNEIPHEMAESAIEIPEPVYVDQCEGKGFTRAFCRFDGLVGRGENR